MSMGSVAWLALLAALAGAAAFAADAKDEGDAPAPVDAATQAGPEEAGDRARASEQAEPPPAEAPQPTGPEPAPATAADAADSPEVFVPTEDISEDLSVRFPVDI